MMAGRGAGELMGGRRWERSFPRFRSRKSFCLRALAIFKQVERLVGPLFERRSVVGGQNQFHCHKDLYDAIERKDFPSWTLKVQVMPEADAATSVRSCRVCAHPGLDANEAESSRGHLRRVAGISGTISRRPSSAGITS
jgi:hypothetical protein